MVCSSGFPPTAYIIGAQKCGTTSLADLLHQHPALALSDPKEPSFYTRNWGKGLDWYARCFKGSPETMLLDASTSYTSAPPGTPPTEDWSPSNPTVNVPKRIHDLCPDARFIYILRDPVERTYSSYWHSVRAGEERRPFREAIIEDSSYIRMSKYHSQITKYLDYFNLNSIHIINFKNFIDDPIKTSHECFRFLEIDPNDYPVEFANPKNKSFHYNLLGARIQNLLGGPQRVKLISSAIKSVVPKPLFQLLKKATTNDIPPISHDDRAYLQDYFFSENEKLRALTGISF